MRPMFLALGLLLGLSLALAACSGASQPAATQTPAPVQITLSTDPNPPATGPVEIVFTVLDAQGQPVSSADVDVIASHKEMGGMTMHGKATDQGNGKYAITANYSMSGEWLVTVQVKKEDLNFKQDIDFQVQ